MVVNVKLYQVKSKKYPKLPTKTYQFAIEDYGEGGARDHLKDMHEMEFDFRTLKEIEFPRGEFKTSDLDRMHYIFFDGELIVSWNDDAHIDYPEDLCWSRDISGLVDEAIELGKLIARREMSKKVEIKPTPLTDEELEMIKDDEHN